MQSAKNEEIPLNGQEKQALIVSLRLLAASPKSRKALEKKLEAKGFDREVIGQTLDFMEGKGFLNDRLYAQALFQSLVHLRPSGRKRIAFEMKKKGVPQTLVEELIEKFPAEEERERAFELARQKQARWCKLDAIRRRKKIYDFLARRGFDFTLVREVVEEIET